MGRPLNHKLFTGSPHIVAHARVVGAASVKAATISRQIATSTYVMTTDDGTSPVELAATATPDEGQGYIIATDSKGSTYFVTKLTAHLAHLVQKTDGGTGFEYVTGAEPIWSFATPVQTIVQIENAA